MVSVSMKAVTYAITTTSAARKTVRAGPALWAVVALRRAHDVAAW